MHHPVVGASKSVSVEDFVGVGNEIAIGEKQQLDKFKRLFFRQSCRAIRLSSGELRDFFL